MVIVLLVIGRPALAGRAGPAFKITEISSHFVVLSAIGN